MNQSLDHRSTTPRKTAATHRVLAGPSLARAARAVAILVLGVLGVVAAAPANAATYGAATGRPGAVATGVIAANGTEKPYTTFGSTYSASLRVPNLTIYRSPATTGAQTAGIVYRLVRWDISGRWVTEQSTPMYTVGIPAGRSAVSIDQGFRLAAANATWYYIQVDVVWATPGSTLGARTLVFNHASDYRCVFVSSGQKTGICSVYNAGYVLVS